MASFWMARLENWRFPGNADFRSNACLAESQEPWHQNVMNLDRIRERVQNGFKPFLLELSSGNRIAVPHPDFIAIGKSVVVILGKDDSVTSVDALHIVTIEDLPLARQRR